MTLGQKLYELRKSKNISQEKAAEHLNVTRQTVSKWETDQSTPDFDKIMPLCELYGISPQELLTGQREEEQQQQAENDEIYSQKEEPNQNSNTDSINAYRKRHAVIISISVFLYIMSAAALIGFTVFSRSPIVGLEICLVLIAIATMLIVFSSLSKPKQIKESEKQNPETKLYKQITSIISSIILVLYLLLSFWSGMWHITWLLWVIYAIICEAIKLIFTLKGADIDEENQ